jgi:predicted nucleotidyltransferase
LTAFPEASKSLAIIYDIPPTVMKPSHALAQHRLAIREVVQRHGMQGVRVFGSAASGEDVEGSDLDLLIEPGPATTLLTLGALRRDLTRLLGLQVDVVTPASLPERLRADVLERSLRV